MVHFTFVEETSNEPENIHSDTQEKEMAATIKSSKSHSILKKTANFLLKYFDQSNSVRIFISKN